MEPLKQVAQYCAEHIEDWDVKVELALRHIGRRMPIDYGFRNEIEDAASEWADENGYAVDFIEGIDVEDIVMTEI